MDTSGILTPVDRLRVAMLQIHLAYAIPDGHVLNPINVAEIDLQRRDPDNGGGYLYSRPDGDTGVARLWRLPVVESPSMTVNEFLTGAFKYSVHLYDRQGVTVAISTENDDDFETNKATMRCESRIGLGVRRPYGLVSGSLKSGS
jgi:HK97 family phage major capsid protein